METQIHNFTINEARKCGPCKNDYASKYDYGKVLVIAGSENIYGAAFMCAKSAFYSGAGMVKVITHINNKHSFEQNLYEAMYYFYDKSLDETEVMKAFEWSDTIVAGPGLSTDSISFEILKHLFMSNTKQKNIIIDADAINLFSTHKELFSLALDYLNDSQSYMCITPHERELKRLLFSLGYEDISEKSLMDFYNRYHIVVVKKGHNSLTVGDCVYRNTSGNEGMATAGSGDVLSGILGGIMKRTNIEFTKKVASGVFFHGFAGDLAAKRINTISMTAADILHEIPSVWDALERV